MSQYSNANVFGYNTKADPADTSVVVATGTGASDDEFLANIPAGGRGLVITMVSYSVSVAEDTTAQVFKFFRQVKAGIADASRAVSINTGSTVGATTMTIPITQALGDCYRVYFGADSDQDHILNPGESFAVQMTTAGTGAAAKGVLTVHGYSFDVGDQVDVLGGATLTAKTKPNANGLGSIYNLIA